MELISDTNWFKIPNNSKSKSKLYTKTCDRQKSISLFNNGI